jgi:hypothetical protein
MNKFKQLYSAISGFERHLPLAGARRDEIYYDLIEKNASLDDTLDYLHAYAFKHIAEMTIIECKKVHDLLITEFEWGEDLVKAFDKLA